MKGLKPVLGEEGCWDNKETEPETWEVGMEGKRRAEQEGSLKGGD